MVWDSFRKVMPIAGAAADLLYDRLFKLMPGVSPLFSNDFVAQKKNIIAVLAAAVTSLHEVHKIAPTVEDLGKRPVGYGAYRQPL